MPLSQKNTGIPAVAFSLDEPLPNSYLIKNCHGNQIVKASSEIHQADAQYLVMKKTELLEPSFENKALALCTADCLPIVFYYEDKDNVIGAVTHAGWRGFCAGIIQNTLETLIQEAESLRIKKQTFLHGVKVLIGPAIFGVSYECGEDVRQALIRHKETILSSCDEAVSPRDEAVSPRDEAVSPRGLTAGSSQTIDKLYLSLINVKKSFAESSLIFPDLQLLAALECVFSGLSQKNISILRENTFDHPFLYSYRRAMNRESNKANPKSRQWIHLYFANPCTKSNS
jgi:copper oxidase (laccase) domain-containing protein